MVTRDALARLCRARERLRECGEVHVHVATIAGEAGLSPFQFIRQFQAVFGETPQQYRIRMRLEQARALLARSDNPVTDVCLAVGFTSLGTFSSLFARRVGLAPSAYRRAARLTPEPPSGCLTLMAAAAAISEKRGTASSGTL